MSEEQQPAAEPTTQPESVSRGTAGDPTPPKLGGTDFVARAMAKLAEKQAAPANPDTAAPEPSGNITTPEPTPDAQPEGTPTPEPSAAQKAAARIASGQPAPAPEPPQPQEPALDGNMAGLAKIVELEQAQRRDREELEKQRQALEAERQQVQNLLKAQQIVENGGSRLEALAALGEGFTYEDLTLEVLGGKGPAGPATKEMEALRAELAQLRAAQEALPKEYEEKLKAAEEARLAAEETAWKQQHAGLLASDRGKPLEEQRWGLLTDPSITQGRNPVELVMQVMEDDWKARGMQGAVLPFDQAADMLEAEYEKIVRQNAHQPSKLTKILGLTSPALTAPTETPAPTVAGGSVHAAPSQTLTPDLASRAPASPPQDRPMSAEDWKRRATEVAQQEIGTKGV